MRIRHSDEYNPAGCSVCGKVFKNKYSLRAHINIYHKEHSTVNNVNNQSTYQVYNNSAVGQQQMQQQHQQTTPVQQQPVNNSGSSYLTSTSSVNCFNQSNTNTTTTSGYIIQQQSPTSPFLNKISLDLPSPYQLTNQATSGPPLSPL